VLWADSGDDAREAEVDAGSEEGRCDGQANDLDEERVLCRVSPGIDEYNSQTYLSELICMC
jgi:hypothetical protein